MHVLCFETAALFVRDNMNSPAVSRKVLIILAGAVWTAVGIVLCSMATYWLLTAPGDWVLPLVAGLIVGFFVYRFGFLRIVRKNVTRIHEQAPGKEKVCLFAFQGWRSYIIVVIMMTMGYIMRHLPVSRMYLVPVYIAIGVGIFLASLHYYTST